MSVASTDVAAAQEREAELMARVQELVPKIRERADEAERLRRLSDATIEELAKAGVFRMHVPAEYGGYELGLRTHFEVFRMLARACVSTAWTASFLTMHNHFFARWPKEFQDEVFSPHGYVLDCGSQAAAPGSLATPVDGGYRVTGRWAFNSGVMHANWCHFRCAVAGRDDAIALATPATEVTIIDNWDTTGMRGTGSHDVELHDVFVPTHRTLDSKLHFSANNPGRHARPDYVLASYPLHRIVLVMHTAYALGAAERAMEIFRDEIVPGRKRPLSRSSLIDAPVVQARYAHARLLTHVAGLLAEHQVRSVVARVNDFEMDERAILSLDSVACINYAGEAIQLVCRASGGSMHRAGNELNRINRDVEVILNHSSGDWDLHLETAGRAMLGLGLGDRPESYF